jgi:transglutaminase-like putative cysteine protease
MTGDTVRYSVEHVTRYAHQAEVSTSMHVAYLRPRTLPYQQVLDHALAVTPDSVNHHARTDYFGNTSEHFAVVTPYTGLSVTGRCRVEMTTRPMPDTDASVAWESVREAFAFRPGVEDIGVAEFCYPSPYVTMPPELAAYAADSFPPGCSVVDGAIDLMRRIHREFVFDPTATSVATPVTRVLSRRRGVCQDFAHLQIGCLRSLGLPARYVSGYLVTDPPPGQPRLVGADASHAWLSVYCPRLGWVDLDPTNDVVPDDRHITLAWGRDYGDVSPLRGVVLGGGDQVLHVGVSVIPGW